MYGIIEGEPFQVYARRQSNGPNLVIRFECKEGMGILGIRKVGRQDPAPSAAYEEEEIDPASLRAGRFVHVLSSGQRQSYALSRISTEVAARLPTTAWVELKPQTEYGFRYLVAPEGELGREASRPAAQPAAPRASEGRPEARPEGRDSRPPGLAEATLSRLSKEQAIDFLRTELAKTEALQRRIEDLEASLGRSKGRERDLISLLQKWQAE